MTPVYCLQNQYRGINAHLHSRWQSYSGWNEFHTNHIADLTRLMRADLYPMGYTAHTEQSLQIRRAGDPARGVRADVLIVDNDALRVYKAAHRPMAETAELVMPLPEALGLSESEREYHKAVAVYRTGSEDRGEPVAWVELLSPSNKPGGQDWYDYQQKRESLLQAGIVFVELDYLHESSPTLEMVADYRTRGAKRPPEPGSHPYRIAVIDPRPEFLDGQARVRQFDVDEAIPVMKIPLVGEDALDFDFGAAYRKTFAEMLYGNEVDYAALPLHFDHYGEADQTRIVNRMLAVVKAAHNGVDLAHNDPLVTEALALDDAITQLQGLAG